MTVFELPPRNQGLIALEALNIAEELGSGDHGYNTVDRVHSLVEAFKRAYHDGHYHITDPDFEDVPLLDDRPFDG
ncbi:hypothetical protein JCM31271_34650 [Halorubrum trueperi]